MSQSPSTRVSLILRLRDSDDRLAWDEFVEIYRPLIIRLAQKKGLQAADANDLCQDVLTRVASAINNWDPDPKQGSFRGWISQITRNLVVDFLRQSGKQPWTGENTSVLKNVQSGNGDSIESQWFDYEHDRQVFAWAAEKAKSSFSITTWTAFWKTAVENQSVIKTAEQLNISRGAVYIARSRVMAKLKAIVESTQFDRSGGDLS